MINNECLKFSIKEYLDYCNNKKNIRAVGVITDKQFIFYSQVLKEEVPSHIWMVNKIENAIHPSNQQNGISAVRDYNVYIFATGANWFEILLPQIDAISLSQYEFLIDCIKQLEEYNQNVEKETHKVNYNIINSNGNKIKGNQVEELKENIKRYIVKNVVIEDEKILGKTLSKENKIKCLSFHIDLSNCKTLQELCFYIINFDKYYLDEFYQDLFLELFPDYKDIRDVCIYINSIGLDDDLREIVTIENIKEILFKYNSAINMNGEEILKSNSLLNK